MSNILILAEPVAGHFNPFRPVIKQFIARGHTVMCMTGKIYQTWLEEAGALFVPLPAQWDMGGVEIYEFFPELARLKGLAQLKFYIKQVMYGQIPDVITALKTVLQEFPADVVIGDTFMLAGVWLAELGGPPSVRLSILPLSLPGKDIAPFGLGLLPGNTWFSKLRNNGLNVLFAKLLFKDVQQHVNQLRQSLSLTPYQKYLFISAIETPNLVLHASTPSFEYPRASLPPNFHFIGPLLVAPDPNYAEPAWWPRITQTAKPVILLTQGTVAKNATDLMQPALTALQDQDLEIVVVPMPFSAQRDVPSNVHSAAYIPFANLLPHVDVMITNGGFGGVQSALACGIPLVVAGGTEEKMEVAARVEYAGVGINLRKQRPSASEIKQAVQQVLTDPRYKQRAQTLQQDFAQYHAPQRAVELVENLIASHQSQ